MALTGKQTKFVVEYLRDFNATQAAIRAGYSKDTAYSIGHENLRKPEIKKAIDEELEYQGVSIARAVGELTKIAYSDMQEYVDIDDGSGAIRARGYGEMELGASRAIKKVKEKRKILQPSGKSEDIILENTFEFELHNKLKALELILQIKGAIGSKDPAGGSTEEPPGFNVSPDA